MSRNGYGLEMPSGIYSLKLPFPSNPLGSGSSLGYVLAYLVEIKGGFVLIDTGWNDEHTFESLQAQLQGKGLDFRDIRYVLVTHHHLDHMGLAARVRERSGAKLAMHSLELPGTIKDYYTTLSSTPSEWFRDWLWRQGMPQDDLDALPSAQSGMDKFLPQTTVDIVLNGGERRLDGLVDMEAVWTPGHSPGHICIYDRRRKVLFAGDHLLPHITPHIALQPHVRGNPLGDYLNALRALRGLDISLVLPAHEYAFTDIDQRISELLEHHEARLAEVLDSLQDGPRLAFGVSAYITWDAGKWNQMSPWLKQMAIFETLAHLEHLCSEGKVAVFEKEGRRYYGLGEKECQR